MIFKEADDRFADLQELERLATEASPSDRANIVRQMKSMNADIAGERDAAHFTNREFGDKERLGLIHDLRFQTDDGFAQIATWSSIVSKPKLGY